MTEVVSRTPRWPAGIIPISLYNGIRGALEINAGEVLQPSGSGIALLRVRMLQAIVRPQSLRFFGFLGRLESAVAPHWRRERDVEQGLKVGGCTLGAAGGGMTLDTW